MCHDYVKLSPSWEAEWRGYGVHAQSLSCVQLFSTPWTVARQAPLSMEFSRQEYWKWSRLPFSTPGESSWPRDQTWLSCAFYIGRQIILPLCHLSSNKDNSQVIPSLFVCSFCYRHDKPNCFAFLQTFAHLVSPLQRFYNLKITGHSFSSIGLKTSLMPTLFSLAEILQVSISSTLNGRRYPWLKTFTFLTFIY